MMDCVVPGGIAVDIDAGGPEAIRRALDDVEAELPELARIYIEHASLADRMMGTGIVSAGLVARLRGRRVSSGRAAGRGFDARRFPATRRTTRWT